MKTTTVQIEREKLCKIHNELDMQIKEIKNTHKTDHNDPNVEEYWRGVRIGLETASSIIDDEIKELEL